MKHLITCAALALATAGSALAQMAEMPHVASSAQYTLDKAAARVRLTLTNPGADDRSDAPVCIALPAGCKYRSATVRLDDGTELPSQMDDLNADGTCDELAFVCDLPAGASRTVTVTFSPKARPGRYASRVYAMMAVRDKRKGIPYFDHKHQWCDTVSETEDTHYSDVFPHGPAIENELVAFRFFFNAKQSTDYYGKRHAQLELERMWWYTIELPQMRDSLGFGEDVIRVGETVSVGTLRGWNKEADYATYPYAKAGTVDPCMQMIRPFAWRQYRIVSRGPVRTIVDCNVQGWEYKGRSLDLKSRYVLYAGQREVEVTQQFAGDTEDLEFVTGAMKVGCLNTDSVELAMIRYEADLKGYCATYGYDWPDGQRHIFPYMRHVGLAVSIPTSHVVETIDRKEQILYGIKADSRHAIRYRFAVCAPDFETFAPTPDGRWTPDRWFEWTRRWAARQPVSVTPAR